MWGAVRKLASAIALLVACCAFPLAAQTVTVTVTWAPGAGGQATSFIVQRSQASPARCRHIHDSHGYGPIGM